MKLPIDSGLVGCGDIAQKHLEAARAPREPWLSFAAVTDIDAAQARLVGTKFGIEPAESLEALLELPLSLVSICTPNQTHASIVRRCLAAGKHVLVEHPMALSRDEADGLVQACRTSARQLFVVRQRRYTHTIQALRSALAEGLLGSIESAHLSLAWNRGPEYFTARPWRRLREGGGVIVNQASHFLDILVYLFGEPTAVSGAIGTVRHAIDCEDSAHGVMSFASGLRAHFELTVAAPKGHNMTSLTLLTQAGPVRIAGRQLDAFEGEIPEPLRALAARTPTPAEGDHAGYFARVAQWLAGDRAVEVVDAVDGARTVRVLEAMHRALTRNDEQLRQWHTSQFGGAA